MALQRTAAKALACGGCQQWILPSFLASVGGSSLPSRPQQQRSFSRFPRQRHEARERIQKEDEHVLNETNEDVGQDALSAFDEGNDDAGQDAVSALDTQARHESLPWYLQPQRDPSDRPKPSNSFEAAANPFAARQQLPPIPDHPPALLQPLLTHISTELGLDDLSLIDLRSLDPPPALGANLLMILGTARSEKHLHVSADRLCRWLRTEHRLKPYADGLLGRNELKLKMRRKAKRSRLLSAVGSKATGEGEMDDGIRTGWVCVNLGRVEGGELPDGMEKVQRAEGVVGFGARTEGCSVVVQMLTEEKREDLDLEKLWRDMLARAKREKGKESKEEGVGVEAQEQADRGGAKVELQEQEQRGYAAATIDQSAPLSIGQQVRAFHSSATR